MGREFVIRNCSRFALCVKKTQPHQKIDLNCFPFLSWYFLFNIRPFDKKKIMQSYGIRIGSTLLNCSKSCLLWFWPHSNFPHFSWPVIKNSWKISENALPLMGLKPTTFRWAVECSTTKLCPTFMLDWCFIKMLFLFLQSVGKVQEIWMRPKSEETAFRAI